jgi:hypothetical protein
MVVHNLSIITCSFTRSVITRPLPSRVLLVGIHHFCHFHVGPVDMEKIIVVYYEEIK